MSVDVTSTPKPHRWRFAGAAAALSLAALAALSVPTFLFRLYTVPSTSMTPTLLLGDYFWASRPSYGLRFPPFLSGLSLTAGNDPQRGEVALFALPRDPQTIYVKRVVGLPGDTIALKGGHLIINGTPVQQVLAGEFPTPLPGGGMTSAPCYTETLPNGVSYGIVDTEPDGPMDNAGPFEIPPGHYFVLGDNRDNSNDSRVSSNWGVGFVPRENFVARADRIAFSPYSTLAHRSWMLKPVASIGCPPKAPS